MPPTALVRANDCQVINHGRLMPYLCQAVSKAMGKIRYNSLSFDHRIAQIGRVAPSDTFSPRNGGEKPTERRGGAFRALSQTLILARFAAE